MACSEYTKESGFEDLAPSEILRKERVAIARRTISFLYEGDLAQEDFEQMTELLQAKVAADKKSVAFS